MVAEADMDISQGIPEEKLIRSYFLGDLSGNEQDRVEERLFVDREFFETLLVIEGELVEDYAFGRLPKGDRRKLENTFLISPQQYQKVMLVKTLKQYASSNLPSSTRQAANAATTSRLKQIVLRSSLTHRRKSSRNEHKQSDNWEALLSDAQTNRKLISGLMADNWLGLQLLIKVKAYSPATLGDLASSDTSLNRDLGGALSRLVQSRLVDEDEGEFSCSLLGSEILEKLENLLGSAFRL